MKKILLIMLFGVLYMCAEARPSATDSLIKRLDKAVENSDRYIHIREERINLLKERLADTNMPSSRYNISMSLYGEYSSFQNDSAIAYLGKAADYAGLMGREDLAERCNTLIVKQLSVAGFYAEGLARLF